MSEPSNPPRLWYASAPGSVYWDCGPYKTPEEAVLAFIKEASLQVGDWVAVGYLKPHRPKIPAEYLIETIKYADGVTDKDWLDGVTAEQERLLEVAVQAAILDWLRTVDQMPAFGTIDGIQEYQIGIGGVEL